MPENFSVLVKIKNYPNKITVSWYLSFKGLPLLTIFPTLLSICSKKEKDPSQHHMIQQRQYARTPQNNWHKLLPHSLAHFNFTYHIISNLLIFQYKLTISTKPFLTKKTRTRSVRQKVSSHLLPEV